MTDLRNPSQGQFQALLDLLAAELAHDPRPATAAQRFLLPRNAHPSARAPYRAWIAGGRATPSWPAAVLRLLRGLPLSRPIWQGTPLPPKAGLLVLSHYLGRPQPGGYDDYFGRLVDASVNDGPTVIAQINHTWSSASASEEAGIASVFRGVLARGVPLHVGLVQLGALGRAGRDLAAKVRDKNLSAMVRADALAGPNQFAMGLHHNMGSLVKRLQPKAVILTWEGHPWERLAIHAARQAKPDIRCIAYHHGIVFPEQMAAGQMLGDPFDPDAIVTCGEIAARWYRSHAGWTDIPIAVVGSPRGAIPAAAHPRRDGGLLVAPEGILEEAVHLFGMALEAKRIGMQADVALRLHPALSRNAVIRALPCLATLPQGVRWSDGTLNEAFSTARTCLYRGSTVSVQALRAGVRPITVDDTVPSINPLLGAPEWCVKVVTASDLVHQVNEDLGSDALRRQTLFDTARFFADHIFAPPNPAALETLLAALCAR